MDPSAPAIPDSLFGNAVPSFAMLALLAVGVAGLGILVINRQLTVRRLRQSEQAFRDLYDQSYCPGWLVG